MLLSIPQRIPQQFNSARAKIWRLRYYHCVKRTVLLIILILLSMSMLGRGQTTGTLQGFCTQGGVSAVTQGAPSTNNLQGVIPSCMVKVYLTGTTNLATIYSNSSGAPLANPFYGNALGGINPGGWIFWSANGVAVDVIGSGGIAPNTYSAPTPLCVDCYPSVAGGGGGSGCTTGSVAGWAQFSDGSGGCQSIDIDDGVTTSAWLTINPFAGDTGTQILASPNGGQILLDPTVGETQHGTVTLYGNDEEKSLNFVANGGLNVLAPHAAFCGLGSTLTANDCSSGNSTGEWTYHGELNVTGGEFFTDYDSGIENNGFLQAYCNELDSTGTPYTFNYDTSCNLVNATSIPIAITLDTLDPGIANPGLEYFLSKDDSSDNTVTISASSGQQICSASGCASSLTLSSQYQSADLIAVFSPDLSTLYWQVRGGGGGGSFTALSGDATSTSTGGATTVQGLEGVPFCTGYTPTDGQAVTLTTGSSPNPCYTAATPSGAGNVNGSGTSVAGNFPVWTNTSSTAIGPGSTAYGPSSFDLAGAAATAQSNAETYASDGSNISSGTVAAARVATLNQNTTGTAANLSGTPALPNGATGTTQTVGDNTTKLATDAFVLANTGTGTMNDSSGTSTAGEYPVSTTTPHTYGLQTASALLAAIGAAPALAFCSDEATTFTPANGLCYFVTASVSTATPAASAFVLFNATTTSSGTLALTGTTIADGGGCSSYIVSTTLTLTSSHSVTVKSDGTSIMATCI